jgi:hypothetical protein
LPDTPEPKQDKYSARLTEAVEQLRGNVKWTLVAFGAIGTTLLAGSQLSNLGKFTYNDPRLWIALLCAIIALGAASFAVYAAQSVASTGYTELNSLAAADIAYVERNNALLEGFKTINAIKKAYEDCIATRHKHLVEGAAIDVLKSDKSTYLYLDGLVDNVLSYIRYNRVRQQVEGSRRQLTWASIFAAAGLVGFAWAANPASDHGTIVLQAPASLARLTLTEAGKKTLAPMLGATCATLDRIDIIVLNVTTAGSEAITSKTKDCPLVRFTVSDTMGKLSAAAP